MIKLLNETPTLQLLESNATNTAAQTENKSLADFISRIKHQPLSQQNEVASEIGEKANRNIKTAT